MIVCVCRKVSDRQIRQAVAEGANSLEHLQRDLGVATQCGRCADCARRVLCEAGGSRSAPQLATHGLAVPQGLALAGR